MVVDSWFTLLMYIIFRFDRDHVTTIPSTALGAVVE